MGGEKSRATVLEFFLKRVEGELRLDLPLCCGEIGLAVV